MLKLRLTPYRDDITRWTWDGTRYTTADHTSEIAPFRHPLIEQLAVTDGARTLIVIRERVTGRDPADPHLRRLPPPAFDQARTLAAQWPADHVLVETFPAQPAQVTAGPQRTTPLYLAHDERSLHGSWDMADLREYATGLNPKEAARLLIYRPRYSTETLFRGIDRLTERATAHYGSHLAIRYPAPALHTGPRSLAADADVLAAFTATIDDALAAQPWEPQHTVFHLTGGFDSGTLATRAAQLHPHRLATAALLIGGPGRAQQIRRRKEIRGALPFHEDDLLIDAMARPPLAPGSARVAGQPISPYEEPLHHPFTLMTQAIADHGAHTVVTGLGGDEMVALSQAEHPHRATGEHTDTHQPLPWIGPRARAALEYADDAIAPPAVVNSMTLLSLETTAPVLLREGVWPLHPFAHPAMVALGEQLPLDWRHLKQLQRRQLAAHGLSDDVTQPIERESFAEVVQHVLTTQGRALLATLLHTGSPLFEAGLVDPNALRAATDRLTNGTYHEHGDAQLLQVINLHLAARAYT